MAYCTQAQVEQRWASTKWWSDASAAGSIDATIVASAIAFAEGDINRYVGQQYAVPLDLGNVATAGTIAAVAVVLAGWNLATRAQDRDAIESMGKMYDEVLAWLKMVASGDVGLEGETIAGATTPSGGPVVVGEALRVTRESFKGW